MPARTCGLLRQLEAELDPCQDLRDQIAAALVDECPLTVKEGGIIRPGYHADLDHFRELAAGGKQWMAQYQAQEIARTGIPKLKVGYNKVFGYYIEVSAAQQQHVPDDYIRKQTTQERGTLYHAGAERVRRAGVVGRREGQGIGVRAVRRIA